MYTFNPSDTYMQFGRHTHSTHQTYTLTRHIHSTHQTHTCNLADIHSAHQIHTLNSSDTCIQFGRHTLNFPDIHTQLTRHTPISTHTHSSDMQTYIVRNAHSTHQKYTLN